MGLLVQDEADQAQRADRAGGMLRQLVLTHARELTFHRRICHSALSVARQRHSTALQHAAFLSALMNELCREADILLRSMQWRVGNGLGIAVKAVLGKKRRLKRPARIRALIEEFRAWERAEGGLPGVANPSSAIPPEASLTGEVAGFALWTQEEIRRLDREGAQYLARIPVLADWFVQLDELVGLMRKNIRFRIGDILLIQVAKAIRPRVNTAGFLRRIDGIEESFRLWQACYAEGLEGMGCATPSLPAPPGVRWPGETAKGRPAGVQQMLRAASQRESQRQSWELRAALRSLRQERDQQRRHLGFLGSIVEQYQQEYDILLRSKQWQVGNALGRAVKRVLGQAPDIERPARIRGLLHRFFTWRTGHVHRAVCEPLRDVEKRLNAGGGGVPRPESAAFLCAKLKRVNGECAQLRQDVAYVNRLLDQIEEELQGLRKNIRYRMGDLLMAQLVKVIRLRAGAAGFLLRMDKLAACHANWAMHYRAAISSAPFSFSPEGVLTGTEQDMPKVEAVAGASPKWITRKSVPCRVIQATPPSPRNPYYTLLSRELEAQGWSFVYIPDFGEIERCLKDGRCGASIVHFHQLDALYHDREGKSLKQTRRNAEYLVATLKGLKEAGARLVWTKHNPYPHVRDFREVDEWINAQVAELVDRVVVLGEAGLRFMGKYTAREKLALVPHPSYAGAYGAPRGRDEARARLGIPPKAFVFGNVGEVRAYKGHELIIEAFRKYCAESGDPEAFLLIAGKPGPKEYVDSLAACAGENILVHAHEIDDTEMAWWLAAMDAAVFAFSDIWCSGSALLALSYGVPVIVPEIGFMPEYVREEDHGFLYAHNDAGDFAAKMAAMRKTAFGEHMRYMCGKFNRDHDAREIADRLAGVYLGLIEGGAEEELPASHV